MGRVGTGAYDFLRERYGDVVIGCDSDPLAVKMHQEEGRNVVQGDPTDHDFWERTASDNPDEDEEKIRLALLAMPKYTANVTAAKMMIKLGYTGLIAAGARFDDEVTALKEAGVHAAYNFFNEAGTGLAEHVFEIMENQTSASI